MVWRVLRAPVAFFDANPIGAILTRFSKDIAVTDFLLPMLLNATLMNGFKMIVSTIFIIVSVPWNIVTIIVIALPMYLIRKWSIVAQNDAQRFESISRGPLNTRFGSVIDGITSIRVSKKEEYFTKGFLAASDLNASAKFTFEAIRKWSGMRLDL